jgi:hypothetical protein
LADILTLCTIPDFILNKNDIIVIFIENDKFPVDRTVAVRTFISKLYRLTPS